MAMLSPEAESARLAALRAYQVLDTPCEPVFDGLAELASQICQTPICLISLVDEHRQWFKSHRGLTTRETPRELAFCAHALATPDDLLVVEDAALDARFADNALVTDDPKIRFYAGAPLNTPSGDVLGTLCVIDQRPRELTPEQLSQLRLLSRQVVSQLEARRTRDKLSSSLTEMAGLQERLIANQIELQETQRQLRESLADRTSQLEESESRYEQLYQNAPDMMASVDPSTKCVVRCNETLLNVLGYNRDEIVGQPVWNIYHERSYHLFDGVLDEFVSTGRVRDKEISLRRKDGSPVEVSLNINAIRDEDGNILHSDSVLRDISVRKRFEADLDEHTAQLAHISRLATANEMATGIAHEVNQPLYAIKNYAEAGLLQLDDQRFDHTAARTTLQQITSNVDRAAGIIAGLRRLIQPSNNGMEETELKSLLERVQLLVKPELRRAGIGLTVKCSGSLPSILCDQVQIEQLLLNLVLNAVEACTGATEESVRLSASSSGNFVEVCVQDQGKGIADGEHERVFEPFRTTKPSGLGVGLAICRTIAAAHKSELRVEPNPVCGTIARLRLPIGS